ncbi:MAG TPA: hypothetical protein VHQ65_01135 [Thermoanaerobaculia bacterium]|nr:hypothetical protein [Thermoanaerobaculia bacterium]
MKRILGVGLVALLAVAALPAAASTFLGMDQDALVKASDAVIVGEVLDVRSFWNDEATAIVTEAHVQVDRVVLGDAPGVVVVRTFGGQVGSIRIEAHGFPTFEKGQRTLLFLESDGQVARVTGYQQGQFRIVKRASDGVDVAVPALEAGAVLASVDGRAVARPQVQALDTLVRGIVTAADRVDNGNLIQIKQ